MNNYVVAAFSEDERDDPAELTDIYGPFDSRELAKAYLDSLTQNVSPADDVWKIGVLEFPMGGFVAATFEDDSRDDPVTKTEVHGPFESHLKAVTYGRYMRDANATRPEDSENDDDGIWQWGVIRLSAPKEFWWLYNK